MTAFRAALLASAMCSVSAAAWAQPQPFGAIGEKYQALGGASGALGPPVSAETPAPFDGRYVQFQSGFIYWHPSTGAHGVWGEIGIKWNQLGRTDFGYPVTDEQPTPDGDGRYSDFQAVQLAGRPIGSIYWTPRTGAHAVIGDIRQAWLAADRHRLGYPKSDEYEQGGFRRVDFEQGYIRWSPGLGAQRIEGFVEPGGCTKVFRAWKRGDDMAPIDACIVLMGIDAYCAQKGGHPVVDYIPQTQNRYLRCDYPSADEDAGEQFVHIVRGVSEGLEDGFFATAPFLGPAVEAVSCINGVLYACGVLALDIADAARVGAPLTGIAGDAMEIAKNIDKCADFDIATCARVGLQAARHAGGRQVPGEDPQVIANEAQRCADGDFVSCAQLGKTSADAAGVPAGLGPSDPASAKDCVGGDLEACKALGEEAAKPGTPLRAAYASAAQQCASGNAQVCTSFGRDLSNAFYGHRISLGHARPMTPGQAATRITPNDTQVTPPPATPGSPPTHRIRDGGRVTP